MSSDAGDRHTTVSVYMPIRMLSELEHQATAEEHRSVSETVRRAVTTYLEKNRKPRSSGN